MVQRVEDTSDEEEEERTSHGSSEEQESEGEQSQSDNERARKKRKTRGSGLQLIDSDDGIDEEPGKEATEEEEEDTEEEEASDVERSIKRDPKDGYEEGAIVRISCHNFMTYDNVEFNPGPRLNMIIGPNGTGKSTIVSAIALGLAYHPKELGRAREIKEFVKREEGVKEGWVELELKRIGQRNPVIRRTINRNDNKSTFYLNGQTASMADIRALVQELNIQVDNLCCYLPQEKVYEFAKLNPPGLLEATQKSCGDPRLTEWHQKLIVEKRKLIGLVAALETDRQVLHREEDTNRVNERQVRQWEERKRVEDDITLLNIQLPYAEYAQLRHKWEEAKRGKAEALLRLREMEALNQPFLQRRQQVNDRVKELKAETKNYKKDTDELMRVFSRQNTQVQGRFADAQNVAEELDGLSTKEKLRAEAIKKNKATIATVEVELARMEGAKNPNDFNQELLRLSEEIRALDLKKGDCQAEEDPLTSEQNRIGGTIAGLEEGLRRLENAENRREQQLRDDEYGTWAALQEQKRKGFKGNVIPPARVSCVATKPEYARYLDSVINRNYARTILCREYDDYNALLNFKAPRPPPELKTDVTKTVATYDAAIEHFDKRTISHPWSREEVGSSLQGGTGIMFCPQLENFGFDIWASDMIDGPPQMIGWLLQQTNLHKIPVSFSNRPINESLFSNPSSDVRSYIANEQRTTINFSSYGKKSLFTDTTRINDRAVTFGTDASATARRRQLTEQLEKCKQENEMIEEQLKEIRTREHDIGQQINKLKKNRESVLAQKEAATKIQAAAARKRTELMAARTSLSRAQNAPSSETQRKQLQGQLRRKSEETWGLMTKLLSLTHQDRFALAQDYTIQVMQRIQAECNKMAIESAADERDTEEKQLIKYAEDATKRVRNLLERAQAKVNEANSFLKAQTQELQERYEMLRQGEGILEPQEIEANLHEKNEELNGMAQVSEGVMRAFEERGARILRAKEKIADGERKQHKLQVRLERTKKLYEPRLEKLVSRISAKFTEAFDRMGCQGEVRILRKEDYKEWGIEILVAFRDGDPLVPLNGARQSGGERSLSTILYFMSLSTISNVPFSLVDEINQGMDARNERAVLDQLVHNICENDASQYFLITPKLLAHLTYHQNMKVLAIFNGDWCPAKIDLRDWLKRARKSRQVKA